MTGASAILNLSGTSSQLTLGGTSSRLNLTQTGSQLNVKGIVDVSGVSRFDSSLNMTGASAILNLSGTSSQLTLGGTSSRLNLTQTGSQLNVKGILDVSGGATITGPTTINNVLTLNGGTASDATADFRTNTYIKFGEAGASSDWAYLRQIGESNDIKLALDFHDNGDDGALVLRSVNSIANPDTVTTFFTAGLTGVSINTGLNMNTTNKIINLAEPTANQDAATKNYVDNKIVSGNFVAKTGSQTMNGTLTIKNDASYNGILTLDTSGGSLARQADQRFYSTFAATTDTGSRRTADIVAGFNSTRYIGSATVGTWGSEYLTLNVGNNGNLNNAQNLTSEKVRITAAGNVGIGTNAPSATLDVSGNATIRTNLGVNGGGTFGRSIVVNNSTNPSTRDRLLINDNVSGSLGYLYYNEDGTLGSNSYSSGNRWSIDRFGNIDTIGNISINGSIRRFYTQKFTFNNTSNMTVEKGDGANFNNPKVRFLLTYDINSTIFPDNGVGYLIPNSGSFKNAVGSGTGTDQISVGFCVTNVYNDNFFTNFIGPYGRANSNEVIIFLQQFGSIMFYGKPKSFSFVCFSETDDAYNINTLSSISITIKYDSNQLPVTNINNADIINLNWTSSGTKIPP
jgi:hypothetical protein